MPRRLVKEALLVGAGLGVLQMAQTDVVAVGHGGASAYSGSATFRWRDRSEVQLAEPTKVEPNLALMEAMRRIRAIHERMHPKTGKDSVEYVREAREGRLYGYGHDE